MAEGGGWDLIYTEDYDVGYGTTADKGTARIHIQCGRNGYYNSMHIYSEEG
jgi:hypothetical protein